MIPSIDDILFSLMYGLGVIYLHFLDGSRFISPDMFVFVGDGAEWDVWIMFGF